MYQIIEWPEVQELMDRSGFYANACLINDIEFLNANNIGDSAYFVNTSWLDREEENE